MNVETYLEAKELYDKYSLCESVLEYLSDADLPQGQKYLETLKMFVNVFPNDFMMFVHNKMQEIGAMFEELHCPEHSESGLQPPILPPTEEKEPKFPIGSKVEIIEGIGKGDIGVVKDYNPTEDRYYVVSDNFYMWFAEADLKAYVEESEENPEDGEDENSEEPTMKFKVDDIVKILSGESEGKMAKVVYCDASDNSYRVEFLDNGATGSMWYQENDLELYTNPETPEENGGAATPDEGEQ